jgi:hypothetical protein
MQSYEHIPRPSLNKSGNGYDRVADLQVSVAARIVPLISVVAEVRNEAAADSRLLSQLTC